MAIRGKLVLCITTSTAIAQTTTVVPNGAALAPYIAAAAPGDTLLLGASHPNFTLTKGLNLVGNGTAIQPDQYSPTTTVQIPAGQRASFSDLMFPLGADPQSMAIWGSNLQVHGDVRFDRCSVGTMQGAFAVTGGTVLLRNCQLYAWWGGQPLLVSGGVCSLVDSSAIGGDGGQTTQGSHDASPGIQQTGGTLWIAGCTVAGGDLGWMYGTPVFPAMPAFHNVGGTAFVVDSTLTGGNGASFMGYPVPAMPAIQATNSVQYARCTLTGGAGSPSAPPTTGNATAVPDLLGITATGALTQGSTFQVQAIAGASGQLLAIAVSLQTDASPQAFAAQPVLGGGTGLVVDLLAVPPSAGSLVTTSLSVPSVPALRGTFVTWQAFQWTNGLVQASPLVGGTVH